MLNLDRTQTPGIYQMKIIGAISESSDFTAKIENDVKELHVNCKAIVRINSMGITKWILFFRDLRKKGVKLKFFEVGVSVVNLCNFVSGMVEKDEVQSIALPFFCENCNTETEKFAAVDDLRATNFKLAPLTCPSCGQLTEFDGAEAHYFDFLTVD